MVITHFDCVNLTPFLAFTILIVSAVNTVELKRLKDTFSKYATSGGLLQQSVFFSDILGDTVPNNLAEVRSAEISNVLR